MRILLLTGYKRTGKDYFRQQLNNKNLGSWSVYKHPESRNNFPDLNNLRHLTFNERNEINAQHKVNYLITGWQFPREHYYLSSKYSGVITARLFCDDSNNYYIRDALDNWCTEYLIVRNTEDDHEFRNAIKYFPHYKNYTMCDSIEIIKL